MRLSAIWYPVANWEAAKQFYGEVLGLQPARSDDLAGWAAFSTGGLSLFLLRRPDLAGRNGGAVVTFETGDLEALRDRIMAAGGRVEDELQRSPGLLIMTFYDPDGNRLEAAQRIEE